MTAHAILAPADLDRERLVDQLIADLAGTIAVLNDNRDGVQFNIPDELVWERARACAAIVLGNYKVEGLE